MSFISRHTATRIGSGIGGSARVNQAEEIVGIPWLTQLALEGRVFIAGQGLEEGGTSDDDGVLDEEGTLALVAPSSGTIVIPLFIRAYFDTEQAQIPGLLLAYVQEDKAWGDGTGTALVKLNCLGGATPNTAKALVYSAAVAATAIADGENVVIHERTHLLASFITNETKTTDVAIERLDSSSTEFIWTPEFPIMLNEGSAVYLMCYTPSSQSAYNLTVSWAELDSSVYGL